MPYIVFWFIGVNEVRFFKSFEQSSLRKLLAHSTLACSDLTLIYFYVCLCIFLFSFPPCFICWHRAKSKFQHPVPRAKSSFNCYFLILWILAL